MRKYIQGHKHRLGCFNIRYTIEEFLDKRFELTYQITGQPSVMHWLSKRPTEEEVINIVRKDKECNSMP